MTVLKSISALFGLLLCTAFAIAFLPNVANLVNTARTDPIQQTGLACTSDGAGVCTITLANQHMHSDTSGMTVLETSPSSADRTVDTTVGSNRVTLTITGLAATTGYIFTVDYEKVDAQAAEATGLPDFLNLAPIIFVLMMLVVGIIIGGATMSRTFNR
mgnify:CR=1 FL=1